jgi:GNAT superfamily N-acetyltransferase
MSIHAEKPAVIEVTVGKASPLEMHDVIDLYRRIGGEIAQISPDNTYVARNASCKVVGALTVFEVGDKTAVIKIGGVDPAFREKGVGTQLFKRVIEELKKEGIRSISIDNQGRDKKFYEELGVKELNPSDMRLEL